MSACEHNFPFGGTGCEICDRPSPVPPPEVGEEEIVADALTKFHALTQAEVRNSYAPSEANSQQVGVARLELVRWILDAASRRAASPVSRPASEGEPTSDGQFAAFGVQEARSIVLRHRERYAPEIADVLTAIVDELDGVWRRLMEPDDESPSSSPASAPREDTPDLERLLWRAWDAMHRTPRADTGGQDNG